MQHALFLFGLVLLIGVELIRWLADAPPEVCTGLSSIAWLCLAGPPALAARASRNAERGNVRVGALLVLAGVAALLVALTLGGAAGCGPRNLVLEQGDPPPTFEVHRGPPCRMALIAEGEVQASVEHRTARCRLVVDDVEVP